MPSAQARAATVKESAPCLVATERNDVLPAALSSAPSAVPAGQAAVVPGASVGRDLDALRSASPRSSRQVHSVQPWGIHQESRWTRPTGEMRQALPCEACDPRV
eukprot:CAMPEP_0115888062 /NCGR_PEP_ID=MMETSP0287-20121206/32108_1 /TAXON_ID=412157 /ORGANISM="Chrysochromulina rotalis, Strain UIO044" /LENGTH=103 /DNA_ID=CAMNT_0003344723 /DNA_START=68 /DNA_END=379 /DNA_ORIENTATION=+